MIWNSYILVRYFPPKKSQPNFQCAAACCGMLQNPHQQAPKIGAHASTVVPWGGGGPCQPPDAFPFMYTARETDPRLWLGYLCGSPARAHPLGPSLVPQMRKQPLVLFCQGSCSRKGHQMV